MRKKTVTHMADTVFWYVLYFLPVICYLLFLFIHPGSTSPALPPTFESFLTDIGLTIVADNPIVNALGGFFGANGTLPLFNSNAVFIVLTWYVATYLCHFAIDFILFIPRIAHKWLDSMNKH